MECKNHDIFSAFDMSKESATSCYELTSYWKVALLWVLLHWWNVCEPTLQIWGHEGFAGLQHPPHPIHHTNSHLSFLNNCIYRRPEGSSGHTVHRKPTLANPYLNTKLCHHLTNKQSVLFTLANTAKANCNQESLHIEFVILQRTFHANSYSTK
jgi:hypothetical protein